MAIQVNGGDYEVRVQEFPQAPTATESAGIPAEVTTWVNGHPQGTPVTDGTVDKLMPPIWLASVTTGNPAWIVVYIVVVSRH